jgi:preprotein translocase subunit YajC
MFWLGEMVIFAADAPPDAGFGQLMSFAPLVLIAVMFIVMVTVPNSRDQKKRQAQLAALKKNDRVYTSAGIIGTVANISADGKEVTLKVDDNTKLRVLRKAIEGFYGDTSPADSTPPA